MNIGNCLNLKFLFLRSLSFSANSEPKKKINGCAQARAVKTRDIDGEDGEVFTLHNSFLATY